MIGMVASLCQQGELSAGDEQDNRAGGGVKTGVARQPTTRHTDQSDSRSKN